MVTLNHSYRPWEFSCKSTDTKPVGTWGSEEIRNAETIMEIDTGTVYFYDKDRELAGTDPWITRQG